MANYEVEITGVITVFVEAPDREEAERITLLECGFQASQIERVEVYGP